MSRRHFIIPDTQIRASVSMTYIDWVGRAIAHYKPDVVVHLGDHWDMPSLSSHDPAGSRAKENARYEKDVAAGNEAFVRLCAPLEKLERRFRWRPRKVLLRGNHEGRIERAIENDPRYEGAIGEHHLDSRDWEVLPFLHVERIDGILYSHYFSNVNSGKPIGGSIDNRLNRIGDSFVQGHEQGFLYGCRQFPTGRTRHGLVAGACYTHDEAYKGRQGNGHWRGVVVLNEVEDGTYDIMPLSMSYLKRTFGDKRR